MNFSASIFSPPSNPNSNPTTMMPRDAGEIAPASLLIDDIDDECPHGRTPSLTTPAIVRPGFRIVSSVRQFGFIDEQKGFVAGRFGYRLPSRLCDHSLRTGGGIAALRRGIGTIRRVSTRGNDHENQPPCIGHGVRALEHSRACTGRRRRGHRRSRDWRNRISDIRNGVSRHRDAWNDHGNVWNDHRKHGRQCQHQ